MRRKKSDFTSSVKRADAAVKVSTGIAVGAGGAVIVGAGLVVAPYITAPLVLSFPIYAR